MGSRREGVCGGRVQFAGVEVEIDPPAVFGEPGQTKELFHLVGGKNLQTMGTVSVGEHRAKIATGDRRKSAAPRKAQLLQVQCATEE